MRLMAAINDLNLKIVQARKLGRYEEVKRLRAQVAVLMDEGRQIEVPRSPDADDPPPLLEPKEPDSASGANAATDPDEPQDFQAIMTRIAALNVEIVGARQAGDDERVNRLKEQVQALMKKGISL